MILDGLLTGVVKRVPPVAFWGTDRRPHDRHTGCVEHH